MEILKQQAVSFCFTKEVNNDVTKVSAVIVRVNVILVKWLMTAYLRRSK